MKADETFIRHLEAFFDQKFNDYTQNRIRYLLSEYAKNIPPVIKEVIVNSPPKQIQRRPKGKYKEFVTKEEMLVIANEVCSLYGIPQRHFLNKPRKKATSFITDARKVFCQKLYEVSYFILICGL